MAAAVIAKGSPTAGRRDGSWEARMMGMSLGLEVALVLGVAGMGILALPWSAEELVQSGQALREAARRLLGVRGAALSVDWEQGALVPGGCVPSVVPAPVRLRASA